MKAYKIYFTTIISILTFLSCSNDYDPVLTQIKPSAIDDIPIKIFVLEEPSGSENPLLFTATWTETQFYLDNMAVPTPTGPVAYTLEIDFAGNNFSSPVVLAGTNSLSANLFVKDVNLALVSQLGAEPEVAVDVELRIVTAYGENGAGAVNSTNTLSMTITPYLARKEMQAIYLLGDMNGWNNTNTDFIMYRNNNDSEDETYTYTGRLAAGTYFKFIPEESLGTYEAYCRKDEHSLIYETSEGGSFFNETEGYVTITLNLKDLTYTIENYNASTAKVFNTMGPIGGFCDWDNEPLMTKSAYDPHQWSLTYKFETSTACKFRGDKDWANNWGGDASDFPYGKGVFDGSGADVKLPGTYKIHFNDLTGHYIILLQN